MSEWIKNVTGIIPCAAENKLLAWEPIMDEVDRRAGKECCLEDRCDFTVTVCYDDYAAVQEQKP